MQRAPLFWFFTESWEANKDLGEAPKSCTRKEHESATNSIAKRGQGAIAPCRVKGQRPLWGLGQRPNCSASDQSQGSRQQRCRQRSVPASNFARPQTRPPSCSFDLFHSVAPNGRDHIACPPLSAQTKPSRRIANIPRLYLILFSDSPAPSACAFSLLASVHST